MTKSIKKSLESAVRILSISFSVPMDHLDNPSLCEWCDEDIEEKEYPESNQYLCKVGLMSKVSKCREERIFFLEHDHVGEGNLIHDHEKKPRHPDERREEVEFFERWKFCDYFPSMQDNVFFQEMDIKVYEKAKRRNPLFIFLRV